MCYAIPGKVIDIKDNFVWIDYFGERRKARNDFFDLALGDYVYAQGGFVIQKISEAKAEKLLQAWHELFFKLKEVDLKLADNTDNLYRYANNLRQKYLGNACCIHGIIEFSNFCRNNCLYCGIRKDNSKIKRYRMQKDQIIQTVKYAVEELNFKALVLQSGEDLYYDEEKLADLIKEIKKFGVLLILSIGEREVYLYERLYKEGARGVLLRFETSNPSLYEKYRPGYNLEDRLNLIKELHRIGYLIFTGFLIGLPGQSNQDILNDIYLTGSLKPEMFSFGPFIPHPDTPLGYASGASLKLVLDTIAKTRIIYPSSRILVTTALETLDKEAAKLGLLCGGNSLMINLTPTEYKKYYEIYPGKASLELNLSERIKKVLDLLYSLGRVPTDLGLEDERSYSYSDY